MVVREQTGTAFSSEATAGHRPLDDDLQDGPRRPGRHNCCPLYHEAVELVGRRWTGAILQVLMEGPMRFSEIAQSIPELSDRLLSERMKELESRGMVQRTVISGPPIRVQYELSKMGHELEPALAALQSWARRWLGERPVSRAKFR
jgi:DNA-binding HxlR family transcriptional regulator